MKANPNPTTTTVYILCKLQYSESASMAVMVRMGALLFPVQLEYGTPLGAEAATCSARLYLANLCPENVILMQARLQKRILQWDKMLEAAKLHVHVHIPEPICLLFSHFFPLLSRHHHQLVQLSSFLFCLVIFP